MAQRARELKSELENYRNAFLTECYRQAFVLNNLHFAGQVAHPRQKTYAREGFKYSVSISAS